MSVSCHGRLSVFLILLHSFLVPAESHGQDCETLGWIQVEYHPTALINAEHVFCGELAGTKKKGFHTMALATSAARNLIKIPPTPQHPSARLDGIYDAMVVFVQYGKKRSTFFPDHCNYGEIVRSISYAYLNQIGRHHVWGVLGPSAPDDDNMKYCLGTGDRPFLVRMGIDADGDVNTAFPN